MSTMYCKKCGRMLPKGASFCPVCGETTDASPPNKGPDNKAHILAITVSIAAFCAVTLLATAVISNSNKNSKNGSESQNFTAETAHGEDAESSQTTNSSKKEETTQNPAEDESSPASVPTPTPEEVQTVTRPETYWDGTSIYGWNFTFTVPDEWIGKIDVTQDTNEEENMNIYRIYSIEHALPLCEIHEWGGDNPGEEVAGDIQYTRPYINGMEGGRHVSVWMENYTYDIYQEEIGGYTPDYIANMKDVNQRTLLELQTGGAVSLEEARGGDISRGTDFIGDIMNRNITLVYSE